MTSELVEQGLHRDQALRDLGTVVAGLVVLLIVLGLGWLLVLQNQKRPLAEVWPIGTPIETAEALALDKREQQSFDEAILGTGEQAPRIATDHLPPILPNNSQSLWQSSQGTQLRINFAHDAIRHMSECLESQDCASERVGQEATAAIAAPAATDSRVCDRQPRTTDSDKRVPIGMLAAAMAWVPECRENALHWFGEFQEYVRGHSRLEAVQRDMGLLYARYQIAKLTDVGDPQQAAAFEQEMHWVLQQIQHRDALQEAYEGLHDLPEWGLSMAEIRADWMLARARKLAHEGSTTTLARRMVNEGLFKPAVVLGPSSAGTALARKRLQLVWCALTLRAGEQAGVSDTCLDTLTAQKELPPALMCALATRVAIKNGSWKTPDDRACGSGDEGFQYAQDLMIRVAERGQTWSEALRRYDEGSQDQGRQRELRKYLDAYARGSGNFLRWLWHEHTGAALGVLLLLLLPLGMALLVVWAYFWRRKQLWHFLPPHLSRDTLG